MTTALGAIGTAYVGDHPRGLYDRARPDMIVIDTRRQVRVAPRRRSPRSG